MDREVRNGFASASDSVSDVVPVAFGDVASFDSVFSSDSPPSCRGVSSSSLLGSYRVRPAAAAIRASDGVASSDIFLGSDVAEYARTGVYSPRDVTRGETSPRVPSHATEVTEPRDSVVKIDWLNVTFPRPSHLGDADSPRDFLRCRNPLATAELRSFRGVVEGLLSKPIASMTEGNGMFGFKRSFSMEICLDDGATVPIGFIAFGGKSQRGKWFFQLNGKGCGLVKNWAGMRDFLEDLGAQISRTDLAMDFLNGEYCVDDAVALYQEGAFISRGRNPKADTQGGWIDGSEEGRTLYIGKLKNGKELCVYEKGKQLNMKGSNWTRFEVRLGNRDRVVPLEVLTNPDIYFAGAYPALEKMIEKAAQEIPTQREELRGSLAHALYHAKRCYGKYLHMVQAATGCDAQDLVEEIRIPGMPNRLDPAAVSAGIEWKVLQEQIRSINHEYAS